MLQLDQLRVLVAIAESGSLAGAARTLYRSQPTVSHHLAALEAAVGGRLVERGPTGAHLTELGELVARRAAVVLAGADRLENDSRTHSLRTVSIGAFPSAAATLLPGPLRNLRERRLGFRLEIAEPTVIATRCRELAFDLAILATEPRVAPVLADGLASEPLLDDPLLVLLPPGHRLLTNERLSPADLTNETWIAVTDEHDPEYTLLLRVFSEAGRELQPAIRVDDYAVTQALVASELGLALMPQLAYDQISKGLQARPVTDPRFARRLHLAWRKDRAGVEQLINDIQTAAAATQPDTTSTGR